MNLRYPPSKRRHILRILSMQRTYKCIARENGVSIRYVERLARRLRECRA